ncbi:MAG: hydrogenase nickel incorporation protein HypB [Candidatus Omnitrophica bacterium]|nr:hydrogenase nickel incorporation protein HypB [Candidatus Omnitrophota bacterium]
MNLKIFRIEENLLAENERLAEENRQILGKKGIVAFNLMGGPGTGKTSLLEKTIPRLPESLPCGIIEGDVAGSLDGERLARLGVPVVQINTGSCHLDASMVRKGLEHLPLERLKIIFVENVGNLVCPAEFPLGTDKQVVVSAVTEGDDKPVKYPLMFQVASLCLLNKVDLLPAVNFSVEKFGQNIRQTNSSLKIISLSAQSGENLNAWVEYVISQCS